MPLTRSRLLPKLPWKALYFDGTDDYVEVPSFDLSDFAIETLVFRAVDSGLHEYIVSKSDSSSYDIWLEIATGDKFRIEFVDVSNEYNYLDSITNADTGKWYHVVGMFKLNDAFYIYINGSLDSSGVTYGDATEYPRLSTRSWWIGRLKNYYNFNGYIAFVRIYSRVLSDSEIEWNYYHPDDPVRNGLVLWLHYDSIDEDASVWNDKTAYGNDGTIYGATAVEYTKPPYRTLSPSRTLSPVR